MRLTRLSSLCKLYAMAGKAPNQFTLRQNASQLLCSAGFSRYGGIESADWQSAIQQVGNLRYFRGRSKTEIRGLFQAAPITRKRGKNCVLLALALVLCASANSQEPSAAQSLSSRQNLKEIELVSGRNRLRIDPATGRIAL